MIEAPQKLVRIYKNIKIRGASLGGGASVLSNKRRLKLGGIYRYQNERRLKMFGGAFRSYQNKEAPHILGGASDEYL
jgi:hypothetical protein